MAEIRVTPLGEHSYTVEVKEGRSKTLHEVTLGDGDAHRYGGENAPERLVEASFGFLLEREPKESILRHFELSVIEQYFPEYPEVIKKALG